MRTIGSKLLLLSLIAGLLATGCSDSDSPTPAPAVDGGLEQDGGFAPDAEAMIPDAGDDCPRSDPVTVTPDPNCNAAYIALVRGQAIDQSGAPIDGVLAQMCIDNGTDMPLCLRPESVCADGYFELPIPENDRCIASGKVHMIPADDTYASTHCPLDLTGAPGVDYTVTAPFTSYALEAPTTLPDLGQDDQARTVVFAGGIEVDVVPGRLALREYATLASRQLTEADPVPCKAESLGLDGIVAFGPAQNIQDPGVLASPGFPVRIPAGGLAEGTEVDLFVQGSLDCYAENGDWVPQTDWVQFATATVDANGMIAGARLPCFSWLGWRAR